MHSSCGVASKSCTRSTLAAPAQPRCRQLATFEGMRSVGSVHKCAQTPLRHQKRVAVRASRSSTVTEAKQYKVALLGASGGIGQPLGLLLKMNKLVGELSLYDVVNVVGVAADLSHCNTPVKVQEANVHLICTHRTEHVPAPCTHQHALVPLYAVHQHLLVMLESVISWCFLFSCSKCLPYSMQRFQHATFQSLSCALHLKHPTHLFTCTLTLQSLCGR